MSSQKNHSAIAVEHSIALRELNNFNTKSNGTLESITSLWPERRIEIEVDYDWPEANGVYIPDEERVALIAQRLQPRLAKALKGAIVEWDGGTSLSVEWPTQYFAGIMTDDVPSFARGGHRAKRAAPKAKAKPKRAAPKAKAKPKRAAPKAKSTRTSRAAPKSAAPSIADIARIVLIPIENDGFELVKLQTSTPTKLVAGVYSYEPDPYGLGTGDKHFVCSVGITKHSAPSRRGMLSVIVKYPEGEQEFDVSERNLAKKVLGLVRRLDHWED